MSGIFVPQAPRNTACQAKRMHGPRATDRLPTNQYLLHICGVVAPVPSCLTRTPGLKLCSILSELKAQNNLTDVLTVADLK